MKKQLPTADQKALVRRYLIWAYKSTRESFERIERKTTQLWVDEFVLEKVASFKPSKGSVAGYAKSIEEFKQYIEDKRRDELKLKYADGNAKELHPQYVYLQNRFKALEAAIIHFLGAKVLKEVEEMFELEFTRRIMESKDH